MNQKQKTSMQVKKFSAFEGRILGKRRGRVNPISMDLLIFCIKNTYLSVVFNILEVNFYWLIKHKFRLLLGYNSCKMINFFMYFLYTFFCHWYEYFLLNAWNTNTIFYRAHYIHGVKKSKIAQFNDLLTNRGDNN